MKKYRLIGILAFLSLCLTASAQRFFNLTYDETSVDSVLPNFTYSIPLTEGYRDSVYTSSILYPEFVDMTALGFEDEIARPDELYDRYGAPECDPAWRP